MSKSHGNKGNNLDLMLSIRYEPKKDEITGGALLQIRKLIDSLDYKPLSEKNLKFGIKNKKYIEPSFVPIKDLITVYKWLYNVCNMSTFLPIFTDIISNDMVRIEDIPKFDSLMYKVMGE